MNKSLNYRISLVNPQVWRHIMGNTVETAPVAVSILSTMHNRHIGITPKLAMELAPLILDPSAARNPVGTWGVVLERLFKETEWTDGDSGKKQCNDDWERFAVLLSSIPPYSVMRLAMPIVETACRSIGKCYLFCEDQVQNSVIPKHYNDYSRELETAIKNMAQDDSGFFNIFWRDRSLTLVNYSRRPGMWRGTSAGLPETAPSSLAMMLRLEPEIPETERVSFHPKRITDPQKRREITRIKEGGFTGIHITRRLEDMGDMLLSEFLYPSEIMLDRLLNTGFLAFRRQPKRERLRDVMVVGVMPAQVRPKLSADFIKACWFDFIARFSHQLHRRRLIRSEFRWLEADAFDRMFHCNFLLQDLSEADFFNGDDGAAAYRWEFLMALGWIPHYLDTRRRFEEIPGYVEMPGDAQTRDEDEKKIHTAKQWAYAAWNSQKENKRWRLFEKHRPISSSIDSPEKNKLDIDQFKYVHIMLFLPAPVMEENQELLISPTLHMGEHYKGFNLGYQEGRSVSVTWVPAEVKASRRWAFNSRGSHERLLFPAPSGGMEANQIAGKLEQAWRDQLEKEIWND